MRERKSSWEKGKEAERKVWKVLEKLEKQGVIRSYGQTTRFSQDDIFGVDFYIYCKKGGEIKLQVKTWSTEEEETKYRNKGIEFLCVPPWEKLKDTENKIKNLIRKKRKRRSRG